MREKRGLRVFENRMLLRRIFGLKRKRQQGNGENYIMRSLICTPHQILFGWGIREA
jgi:hypothetical protein